MTALAVGGAPTKNGNKLSVRSAFFNPSLVCRWITDGVPDEDRFVEHHALHPHRQAVGLDLSGLENLLGGAPANRGHHLLGLSGEPSQLGDVYEEGTMRRRELAKHQHLSFGEREAMIVALLNRLIAQLGDRLPKVGGKLLRQWAVPHGGLSLKVENPPVGFVKLRLARRLGRGGFAGASRQQNGGHQHQNDRACASFTSHRSESRKRLRPERAHFRRGNRAKLKAR
ncbi:MAG TPA: hypothetical protein PKN08_03340 [Opitutaceae bacterium]|nr:hypothetical protein [Opitutaceae bacterium]